MTYDKNDFRDILKILEMVPDTSFIYEKLGLESFYGTIARIGIMDKTTAVMKDGQEKMML